MNSKQGHRSWLDLRSLSGAETKAAKTNIALNQEMTIKDMRIIDKNKFLQNVYFYSMKPLLVMISFLILQVELLAQEQDKYAETLNDFFEITGANETYDVLVEKIIEMARVENPDIEEKSFQKILDKVDKSRAIYRKEKLVPLYQKYLTLADLNELINFYKTPIGQKYAKAVPQMTLEANLAGIEWGEQLRKLLEKEIGRLD